MDLELGPIVRSSKSLKPLTYAQAVKETKSTLTETEFTNLVENSLFSNQLKNVAWPNYESKVVLNFIEKEGIQKQRLTKVE